MFCQSLDSIRHDSLVMFYQRMFEEPTGIVVLTIRRGHESIWWIELNKCRTRCQHLQAYWIICHVQERDAHCRYLLLRHSGMGRDWDIEILLRTPEDTIVYLLAFGEISHDLGIDASRRHAPCFQLSHNAFLTDSYHLLHVNAGPQQRIQGHEVAHKSGAVRKANLFALQLRQGLDRRVG